MDLLIMPPSQGCSTETEADPATIAFLIDQVKKEDLPVVFTIELSNGKIAEPHLRRHTCAKRMRTPP